MLKQLRKLLAEKTAALKGLKDKAFADGATKEDLAALEAALAEIDEIGEKIKLAERTEAAEAAAAKSVNEPDEDETGDENATRRRSPARVKGAVTPQQKLGVIITGMCRGMQEHGLKGKAGLIKGLEDLSSIGLLDVTLDAKALNSMSSSQGGVILGENFNGALR